MIKFLDQKDIARITESTINKRDGALCSVLFSTGMRISEALALRRLDFISRQTDTMELSIIGKGGYQRVVFFSPDALNIMMGYLDERADSDPRVFPITPRTAQRVIGKHAKALGVHATPHTFRHSFATHLLRRGANMRVVQEMLGHKSIMTTQIYAGVTNRDLLETHKKFI